MTALIESCPPSTFYHPLIMTIVENCRTTKRHCKLSPGVCRLRRVISIGQRRSDREVPRGSLGAGFTNPGQLDFLLKQEAVS